VKDEIGVPAVAFMTALGLALAPGCGRFGFSVERVDAGDADGQVAIDAPGGARIVALTSGASWQVPADWNNAGNSIECIGGGGAGRRDGRRTARGGRG
jgi:hypothetical protein